MSQSLLEYLRGQNSTLPRAAGGMEEIAKRGAKWFVLLTQYCAGDKIENNEMGWVYGAYG